MFAFSGVGCGVRSLGFWGHGWGVNDCGLVFVFGVLRSAFDRRDNESSTNDSLSPEARGS